METEAAAASAAMSTAFGKGALDPRIRLFGRMISNSGKKAKMQSKYGEMVYEEGSRLEEGALSQEYAEEPSNIEDDSRGQQVEKRSSSASTSQEENKEDEVNGTDYDNAQPQAKEEDLGGDSSGKSSVTEAQESETPSKKLVSSSSVRSGEDGRVFDPQGESENKGDSGGEEGQAHGKGGSKPACKRPEDPLPCPRCSSLDTKFCYFNNYNTNQPRHFCKKCQRYWTAGGTLRNVPVGSGRRKSKQSSGSSTMQSPNSGAMGAKPGFDLPNGASLPGHFSADMEARFGDASAQSNGALPSGIPRGLEGEHAFSKDIGMMGIRPGMMGMGSGAMSAYPWKSGGMMGELMDGLGDDNARNGLPSAAAFPSSSSSSLSPYGALPSSSDPSAGSQSRAMNGMVPATWPAGASLPGASSAANPMGYFMSPYGAFQGAAAAGSWPYGYPPAAAAAWLGSAHPSAAAAMNVWPASAAASWGMAAASQAAAGGAMWPNPFQQQFAAFWNSPAAAAAAASAQLPQASLKAAAGGAAATPGTGVDGAGGMGASVVGGGSMPRVSSGPNLSLGQSLDGASGEVSLGKRERDGAHEEGRMEGPSKLVRFEGVEERKESAWTRVGGSMGGMISMSGISKKGSGDIVEDDRSALALRCANPAAYGRSLVFQES